MTWCWPCDEPKSHGQYANGEAYDPARSPLKFQIPEPKAYYRKTDAQDIDNFVWQLETYFEAIKITGDPTKVRT